MNGKRQKIIDPLFQLFEHHLLTRSYEDSTAFTKEVAEQYLSYLDSTSTHIPFHIRTSVLEDLVSETHEMLVKKMYGVVRMTDYENYGQVVKVKKNDELTTFRFKPKSRGTESDKND